VIWVKDKTGQFAKRPHYNPAELDAECEQIISEFLQKKYGKIEYPVKTDDLTILIEEKADLDLYADLSQEPGEVEGVTRFVPGKKPAVRISEALSAPYLENRLRTTLTHEYGHVHFHRFLFEDRQGSTPSLFGYQHQEDGNTCYRDNMVSAPEVNWMEWQAGYVCGAILMPSAALVATVQRFREESSLLYGDISLASDSGRNLISAVSTAFQTSQDAARVRLLKKGMLVDMGKRHAAALY
jgi:hypothetical protein